MIDRLDHFVLTTAQPDAVIGPHPRPVRPAMDQRVTHPLDPCRVNRLWCFGMEDPGNSAHRA